MNVGSVGQAVDLWALQQVLAMNQSQAMSSVEGQIVNQLASLDPNVGQNLDVSV